MNHDHLWKSLLQAFFDDFLDIVIPDLRREMRTEQVVFLDQEALADLVGGRYARLDIVARVPSRSGEDQMVLVHIEIERDFRRKMDGRMWRYYWHLRMKSGLLVIPIVLFLRGGPEGLERRQVHDRFAHVEISRFTYWAFGLSKSRAEDHLELSSLSPALAACMRAKWSRPELKFRCLEAIHRLQINEAKRFLLVNIVETYLELVGIEIVEYTQITVKSPLGEEIQDMEETWADKIERRGWQKGLKAGKEEGFETGVQKGLRKGLRKGRADGLRSVIEIQLEERFGRLSSKGRQRLEAIEDTAQLQDMGRSLVRGASLQELGLED